MQVLAVDPRGIGLSTKSPPPYTVEGWADERTIRMQIGSGGKIKNMTRCIVTMLTAT
jgi:hypothetical protein